MIDPPEWLRRAFAFGPPVELFNNPAVFRPVSGARKRPDRYFPIAGAPMHRPDQSPGHDQVQTDAKKTERPTAK